MAQDTSCLYSLLRNISGATKKFGFLPPHGKSLAANAEVLIAGNIVERILSTDQGTRSMASFEAALSNNLITIISTPNPIMYNLTTDRSRMLKLTGSGGSEAVVVDDPCWESLA